MEKHVHCYLEGNRHKGLLLKTRFYNVQFFSPSVSLPLLCSKTGRKVQNVECLQYVLLKTSLASVKYYFTKPLFRPLRISDHIVQ